MHNLEQYTKEYFWQVEIEVEKDKSNLVENFFLQSGALGHFELLYQENITKNLEKDTTQLFFFFDHTFPTRAFVPMALETLGMGENDFQVSQIKYQDYLAQFEKTFHSFALTPKTWLVPPYDQNNPEIPPEASRLLLKPGLAFGTGKHETSQLMVAYLERKVQPQNKVIDMGCGSGILAIAAGLFGAGHVIGIDVETLAIESARENAKLNLPQKSFTFTFEAGSFETLEDKSCHIFVSNILPQIFYKNAEQLKTYLQESKHWALSGITQTEEENFKAFLQTDLKVSVSEVRRKGDWLLFAG